MRIQLIWNGFISRRRGQIVKLQNIKQVYMQEASCKGIDLNEIFAPEERLEMIRILCP